MARSINGSLLGRAAATERHDLQERILAAARAAHKRAFWVRWNWTVRCLRRRMRSEFAAWYDSYPADMEVGKFMPIMEAKLEEFRAADALAGRAVGFAFDQDELDAIARGE